MSDDELQQYWDARPFMADCIAECFFFDWPPVSVAESTGDPLETVCWLYKQLRDAEDAVFSHSYAHHSSE
jgi:hypothetical protein